MVRIQLVPRDMRFFDMFEQAAANVVEAATALVELLDHFEDIEEKARGIKAIEHRNDGVTHDIMNELRKTFIPPLEGDDIVALAEALDDVVDYIEDAAARMVLYSVGQPTETARELAGLILDIAREIQRTLPCLRNKNDNARIIEATVEINRLENLADDAERHGLRELFDHPTDVFHVVKWREIYEILEGATDRGEDVADVLEGVVRKS